MNRYASAGFLAFILSELAAILITRVQGGHAGIQSPVPIYVVVFIASGSAGIVGFIFGLIFSRFLIHFPTSNEYINGPFWMAATTLGIGLMTRGQESLAAPTVAFNLAVTLPAGLVFIRLAAFLKPKDPPPPPERSRRQR